MGVISSDKFERADADALGTDAQGSPWSVQFGRFGIRSNRAASLLTGEHVITVASSVNSADVRLSAIVIADRPGERVGLVARKADIGTFYYAYFDVSARRVVLAKAINGVHSVLGSQPVMQATSGTLVLRLLATELKVGWNGVTKIVVDDSSIVIVGGGDSKAGLYSFRGEPSTRWDDWLAEEVFATVAPTTFPTSKPQTIYLKFESDEPGSQLKYSVDQRGTSDLPDTIAEPVAPRLWRGQYTVQPQNAPQYVDGAARVRVKIDGVKKAVRPFALSGYDLAECGGPYFVIDTVGPEVLRSYLSVERVTERPFFIDYVFNEIVDAGMGANVGLVNQNEQVILLPEQVMFIDQFAIRAQFTPPTGWTIPTGIYRICISEVFDCPGNEMIGRWCRSVAIDVSAPKVIQFSAEPRVISSVDGCDKVLISIRTDEPALETMNVWVQGHRATRVYVSDDHMHWVWEYVATGGEREGSADVQIYLSDDLGHTAVVTKADAVVFDFTAPTITFVKPANNGDILTDQPLKLQAQWFDANGVALDSAEILLNGEDITGQCVLTEDGFTFLRY